MNAHHQELLEALWEHVGEGTPEPEEMKAYMGTGKRAYAIATPVESQIVRDFIARHRDLSFSEYLALLNSLYQGPSHNEISLAGKLLELLPRLRKQLEPCLLDGWLGVVEGWAETDSICQSHFTAQEMLARWDDWRALLAQLSLDPNVHKRRASLVLLTRPVRDSRDERLADLAFAHIERLKGERDGLITKAVSWLLRDLIKNHHQRVEAYLEANEATLPRVAVRETRRKLLTGKK